MALVNAQGEAVAPTTRVAICVPSGDHVAAGFAFDLARLAAYTTASPAPVEVRLLHMRGTLLPEVRNGLVDQARAVGATHLLWLDSDMRFPKDALLRLLAHDVDIVGCNYTTRRFPHQPTAEIYGQGLVYIAPESTGLLPVSRMGMGVMLTKMSVFDRMPEPYFALAWHGKIRSFTGEDIFFCRTATKLGIPVLCDTALSLEVAHCGEMEFTNDHALAMQEIAAQGSTPEPPHGEPSHP